MRIATLKMKVLNPFDKERCNVFETFIINAFGIFILEKVKLNTRSYYDSRRAGELQDTSMQ